jgi:hypothetical protein
MAQRKQSNLLLLHLTLSPTKPKLSAVLMQ